MCGVHKAQPQPTQSSEQILQRRPLHRRITDSVLGFQTTLHASLTYCLPMSDVEYPNLLPPLWETQIKDWLHEDLPGFDIGGFVVGNKREGEKWVAGTPTGGVRLSSF